MEPGDIKEVAGQHGIKESSVKILLQGGVAEGDVDSVLEMRAVLSDYEGTGGSSKAEVMASVGSMVEAYNAASGDMDILEILVEKACEKATELYGKWYTRSDKQGRQLMRSRFTLAMKWATEGYKNLGAEFLESEGEYPE